MRKRWGEAAQPEPVPPQKIDSHYSSQNNLKMATSLDHNQGELVPYQQPKPQQPVQEKKQNQQRAAQINALFSGIANEEENQDSDGSDEKKKKKKKKDKKKSKEDKKDEDDQQ